MAHFRGTIQGQRGTTSRLGSKKSGMRVEAQSWQGKVVVTLYREDTTGEDWALVSLGRHNNAGTVRELYRGPAGGMPSEVAP